MTQSLDTALLAWWPLDEGRGAETTDVVQGIADPIRYVFNEAYDRSASDPLWRCGVQGNALLFDGYSTWVARSAGKMPPPRAALTLSAWVAPRAYEWGDGGRLSAIVNQHDREQAAGYLLGVYRHGNWGLQLGLGGQWVELWAGDAHRLPPSRWSHLAATYEAGRLQLYLNGAPVAGLTTAPHPITPCDAPLWLGKNNQATPVGDAFSANMFNGLLDEIRIYGRALDATEVAAAYRQIVAQWGDDLPLPDTVMRRSRYAGDRHRPQYHFIPPGHWMNEPHAPLHFRGKYHLTYQHNPHGPFWHQIHWGHAVSDDLVHWNDLPIALYPEADSVAPDGVWSGSATLDEAGNPVYFFTAGNDSMTPNQMTALARSRFAEDGDVDLKRWVMHEHPVTIQAPDLPAEAGDVWFGHFRDPFVWREGDTWYQLIGTGIRDVGGTALVYTSEDLLHWTYHNPLLVGDYERYPRTGQLWELPVLLPLGDDGQGRATHVFLINPWFDHPNPHNVRYVWYWLGRWDRKQCRFHPDHEAPRRFDYGQHFTGPSGMVDEHGRVLLFSIAQGRRSEVQEYRAGWAHNAGLPLVLSLRDGDLGVEPIPELASLRTAELLSLEDVTLEQANQALAGVGGEMLEIWLEMAPQAATRYGIKVRRSPDAAEGTLVYHDRAAARFGVDRRLSSLDPDVVEKGVQNGPLDLGSQPLRLRLYLDHSMLEAYANGRKSLTTRLYPSRRDALGLQLWADGQVAVRCLRVWQMQSAYPNTE